MTTLNIEEKKNKAKELFKSGYNCSQSVIGVFCEELGLDFDTAIKISSPFGGGMGRMREVCGTVSGMFMCLGLSCPFETSAKGEIYKKVQDLAERFKSKNGSIICRELLNGVESSTAPTPSERTETYYKKRPCIELVGDAVEIFANFLEEQKQTENTNVS